MKIDVKAIQIFDVLFYDKTDDTVKNESIHFLDEYPNKELIGLCIIPPHTMIDGKARFMSFKEEKELTWCTNSDVEIFSGDQGWYDEEGLSNTRRIMELDEGGNYEAASWCIGLNNYDGILEWYLPAIGELRFLIASMNRINMILSKLGYSKIDTGEDDYYWYWSSSEYSSTHARYVDCYYGDVGYDAKSSTVAGTRVRAFLSL